MITIVSDNPADFESRILLSALAQTGIKDHCFKSPKDDLSNETKIITLGQSALDKLLKTTEHTVHNVHGYLFYHFGAALFPTFSPNQIFEQPDRHHWFLHALSKAKAFSAPDPNVTLHLQPTLLEVRTFYLRCLAAPQLSIDIECIRETCELTAIAIAISPTESMSIPFAKQYMEHYWSPEAEAEVWRMISLLISHKGAKIFQNYMFDCMILDHFGLPVRGPIEDTLWIANLLNPELPKGLKDLGRQYLYCEPWKTQKDFTLSGDPVAFWKYNALDAARTFSIYEKQKDELKGRNLIDFYNRYIKDLHNIALDSCTHGIAINHQLYESFKATIGALCEPIKKELIEIANPLIVQLAKRNRRRNKSKDIRGPSPKTGKEIVLTKGYDETVESFNPASPAQVKLVLKTLGYKIPTHKGAETTDQIALLKLQRKASHEFISKLIQFKQLEKLRSSYLNLAFDGDGRCRYTFNRARDNDNSLGTKSGRFGCSATPWNSGLNIQTIPRQNPRIPIVIKDIFVADEGMELLEVDLSQAELRVVAWLSGDPTLCSLLDSGRDVHQHIADVIKQTLRIDANRHFGKFVNHAGNYGMGKYKFCDIALKQLEMVIAPDLAQKVIDLRMQAFPMLKLWQQRTTEVVRRTRRLVSPQGRERYFFGQYDDNMEREALSFIPQATVVDSLNRSWIDLSKLPSYNQNFMVLTQIHDSLLIQVRPDAKDELLSNIKQIFGQQALVINGLPRVIPFDIKHDRLGGSGWGSLKAL